MRSIGVLVLTLCAALAWSVAPTHGCTAGVLFFECLAKPWLAPLVLGLLVGAFTWGGSTAQTRLAPSVSLAIEVLLIAAGGAMLVLQNREVHSYLSGWHFVRAAIVGVVWAAFSERIRPWLSRLRLNQPKSKPIAIVSWLAAIAVTAWCMSSLIFPERSLEELSQIIRGHLPYLVGESAAVVGGLTPRVDFFPQYGALLGYLAIPLHQITPLTIGTWAALQAVLSGLGLLAWYLGLTILTGDRVRALLYWIASIGLAFLPVQNWHDQDFGNFTYFATSPVRYLGTWILWALLAWTLTAKDSRESKRRVSMLGLASGLVVCNNLDWGIPSAGGALLAVALSRPTVSEKVRTAVEWLAGVFVAFALFAGFSAWRSGSRVDLETVLSFQRTFAEVGFYGLPTPPWGLHWVILATFVAGVMISASRSRESLSASRLRESLSVSRLRADTDSAVPFEGGRLQDALLLYVSTTGLGVSTYYLHRSHWQVLHTLFPIWAMTVACLSECARSDSKPLRFARASAWVLFAFCVTRLPSLPQQLARIHGAGSAEPPEKAAQIPGSRLDAWTDWVRTHTRPGAKIMLITPYGHLIALRAGVKNVYPFVEPHSILHQNQIELVRRALEAKTPEAVYGEIFKDLKPALRTLGFVEETPLREDFEIWRRPPREADR